MGRVGCEASPVVVDGTESMVVEVVVVAGVTASIVIGSCVDDAELRCWLWCE